MEAGLGCSGPGRCCGRCGCRGCRLWLCGLACRCMLASALHASRTMPLMVSHVSLKFWEGAGGGAACKARLACTFFPALQPLFPERRCAERPLVSGEGWACWAFASSAGGGGALAAAAGGAAGSGVAAAGGAGVLCMASCMVPSCWRKCAMTRDCMARVLRSSVISPTCRAIWPSALCSRERSLSFACSSLEVLKCTTLMSRVSSACRWLRRSSLEHAGAVEGAAAGDAATGWALVLAIRAAAVAQGIRRGPHTAAI